MHRNHDSPLLTISSWMENCTKFGQLTVSKIIKIVATSCQILRLKCIKFDFGWGSAPHPAGGAHSAPQTLYLACIRDPAFIRDPATTRGFTAVTIDSLWKVVIGWYQNEWPWSLFRGRIEVMSTIALHSTLNISETIREPQRGSKGPLIGNGIGL